MPTLFAHYAYYLLKSRPICLHLQYRQVGLPMSSCVFTAQIWNIMDKQQQIISTALSLFYKKGIHAVGINEILAVSGIAKKTLYKHFESKDALICACLVARDMCFNAWLKKICLQPSAILVAQAIFFGLKKWINNEVSELGNFNGCFFINTAAEYPIENDPIAKLCKQHKQTNFEIILSAFLETPEFAHNREKAIEAAHHLLILKEGFITRARVMHDVSVAPPSDNILKAIVAVG